MSLIAAVDGILDAKCADSALVRVSGITLEISYTRRSGANF